MKLKYVWIALLLVALLIGAFLLQFAFLEGVPSQDTPLSIFVGVDAAYDSLEEIKTLVDAISPYTNLFVLGSTGITYNTTKLDDACQYLYDKGLSFILFTENPFQTQWLETAKNKWGDQFLGFYIFDEVGGRQLDVYRYRPVEHADNYTHASNQFVTNITMHLNGVALSYPDSANFSSFTSDYALYWFDYKAGYDVVFAEFGWNYSRQLNVALNRGAATVQNKDWGVMITWTYTSLPYIESGAELYKDLVYAYDNGAKYILIFDTNKNYTQGILEGEHLEALERFWQYIQDNPRTNADLSERVAYVLPKDYGYGFRGPNDKIWGLWEADGLSFDISTNLGAMLNEHGTKLDIIYDDGLEPNNVYTYREFIFWNGTVINP